MQIIPLPNPGQILLVVTPYIGGEVIFDLAARLAIANIPHFALEVLDGGNTYNAYRTARALRRRCADHPHTPQAPLLRALQATRLARAFTCYQVAAMLEEMAAHPRPTLPLLILDMLATFGDESVALNERRRLLRLSLQFLGQIAVHRPVAIWARKRVVAPIETLEFLARLERAAGRVWQLEPPPSATPLQGRLF
jgi:hypothetical protein